MHGRLLLLAFPSGNPFITGAGRVAAKLPVLALYFFLINAATYVAFWIDKSRAQQGGYRLSESTLLTLSFLGGSPAAFFARRQLRHKTLKQPFTAQLFGIAALQIGALLFGAVLWMARSAFM
jgi:uncharacterized membrane protein YsdA (DUF1294 family)